MHHEFTAVLERAGEHARPVGTPIAGRSARLYARLDNMSLTKEKPYRLVWKRRLSIHMRHLIELHLDSEKRSERDTPLVFQ
jgi:hypothetical protein